MLRGRIVFWNTISSGVEFQWCVQLRSPGQTFFRRCISLTAEQKDQGREPQATSDPKSDWEIQVTNLYNVNPGLIWITVITPKSVSLTWHHLSILK